MAFFNRSILKLLTPSAWVKPASNASFKPFMYYTAYAHKNYSTCKVKFLKFLPHNDRTAFGYGIRKYMDEDDSIIENGYIISNGYDVDIIDPNLETIDRFRFTLDFAGIALIVKEKYQPEYQEIRSFQGNHTFRIPRTDNLNYEYLITAGLSDGVNANTPDLFEEYVKTTALKYNNPVVVDRLELEYKNEGYKPVDYWGWDDVHVYRP